MFEMRIKALLLTAPVLVTPDYYAFKLQVNTSYQGVGAILLQESSHKVFHPNSYFSQKLNKHQWGPSTCEETLALILAAQHFELYLSSEIATVSLQ